MGRTCSVCSMGPPTERYYSSSPAIVNQKSIEINWEVGGWGPNQARMCVCTCKNRPWGRPGGWESGMGVAQGQEVGEGYANRLWGAMGAQGVWWGPKQA